MHVHFSVGSTPKKIEKIGSDVRITYASGNSYHPSLVWTGSQFAVAWWDDRDGNYEIYFARIGCAP